MPLVIGTEQRVNTTTSSQQRYPAVAALMDGGWVTTWMSLDQDSDKNGIYQQRYGSTGAKIGGETRVNFTVAGDQAFSSITALNDGGWVVTWMSTDSNGLGIFQRAYKASGEPVLQSDTAVNTFSVGNQYASHVAALAGGGWVVTWQSYDQDAPDGQGIYQQRYDKGGNKVGIETRVNTETADAQDTASVTALGDGGWVVTWESLMQDGAANGIFQQRYDRNGNKIGPETQVNVFEDNGQEAPSVAHMTDGGWVVAWMSYGQDEATNAGIFQRRYTVTPPPVSLTGTVAKELAPTGAVVGELPVAEPGDSYTYALLDGAGGRFVLSGNQLRVNKGILLDYEQRKTHTVTLMVTDAAGLSTTQTFTIKVGNVSTEKTAGTSAADTVVGGGGKDTLGGGGGNDRLSGGGSTDTLRGGSGHDRLDGGTGKDTLTGNSGKDAFLFTTKPGASNVDTLRDFLPTDDLIRLENAIFKGIGSGSLANPKKMLADAFQLGPVAQDAEDRILYDQATGSLFYDPDGIGAAAAVKFAVVATRKALTLSDFYVI